MSIPAANYLQTTKCAGTFATQEIFELCLPKECIKESIDACIVQYREYIEQLINLFIKKFAEGLWFSQQKGFVFGFGPDAEKDTGNLLKIAPVYDNEMVKLDKVPVST